VNCVSHTVVENLKQFAFKGDSFAASENLKDDKDINSAWNIIKQNIKTAGKDSLRLHELNQRNP
jgi:hypothetical protein